MVVVCILSFVTQTHTFSNRFSFIDRNQYVHRRDSVSLSTLSEKEIQQRIKLGLVTTTNNDSGLIGADDDDEDVEWEDFDMDSDDAGEQQDNGSSTKGSSSSIPNSNKQEHEYILTHSRRASVDLASMSSNSHDETDWESDQSTVDHEPNKRHRSASLIATSIGTIEEVDEEEVATVNGEDEVDEMES